MVTEMSPTYATLTLEYLEENLYEIIDKNTTTIWKQNLLDHGKDTWGEINDLHNLLQNLYLKVKFLMKHNLKKLLLLDILIKK